MNQSKSLQTLISNAWHDLKACIRISDSQLMRVRQQLASMDDKPTFGLAWTFLLACGYSIVGSNGLEVLAGRLCDDRATVNTCPTGKVWLEGMTSPARLKLGPTHVDISLGNIYTRKCRGQNRGSESGIEYKPSTSDASNDWISFTEVKIDDDIRAGVKHDPDFNQMIRLVEASLTFQEDRTRALPGNLYVTLLTPEIFLGEGGKKKLYSRIFGEYMGSHEAMERDIGACILEKRNDEEWQYPDLEGRFEHLHLNWVTIEDLLEHLPTSNLREPMNDIWSQVKEELEEKVQSQK